MPNMLRETDHATFSGVAALLIGLAVTAGAAYGIVLAIQNLPRGERALPIVASILVMLVSLFALGGLFTVAPNQAAVLQLFGRYVGTVKRTGLHWANPFFTITKVSLRVRNFETGRLKVNDHDGNPIEIAAVVVWKVVDSAEASFEVDNYENYVHVQSEAALRNLATAYAYDAHEPDQISLRGNTDMVAAQLKTEIEERFAKAGVEVLEARISHLAYAPEIAQAMLQRQQAAAIIAARQKIVEGAVGMVEMALEMLNQKGVVRLDEERKAAMVSNLLVVLCSERATHPVINTGTIYH
jgi:regulator of protease activity HflC (stomatin/prohibitin superfamily)